MSFKIWMPLLCFWPIACLAAGAPDLAADLRAGISIQIKSEADGKYVDAAAGSVEESIESIHPDLALVTISAKTRRASSIQVQFKNSGRHYYGVWETPHGLSGGLDNRGIQAEFSGTLLTPNVNYSSVRAPFFMTKSGKEYFGVYVKSTALGRFDFSDPKKTRFSFDESTLIFYVIHGGSYADVLKRYNELAGPSVMPPLWAFGSGWWRDDAHDGFHGTVKNAQENVLDDAAQLARLRIPAAWIWIDRPYGTGGSGWGNFDFDSSFPDPAMMIKSLSESGYNLLLWIANKNWQPSRLWSEATQNGYLYRNTNGSSVDLKKAGVYDWFEKKLEHFAEMGIKGYKIDRGEEAEDQIPAKDKNSEIIDFSRLASESMEHRWGTDHFDFARNLNDTGRRYSTVWGGDPRCTFGGLKTSVALGIRAGLIDFPMWGSDTGGILCHHVPGDVFARWFAFSAYSPMMEVLIGDHRTPWYEYDGQTVAIAKKFSELHHLLVPYTRSEMYSATQTGMPIMRALVLDYPDDAHVSDLSDEYLYGGQIMVAPVTEAGVSSRSVYFPEGRWLSFPDGKTVRPVRTGGHRAVVPAAIDQIPAFVREGAIVPMGDILQANNNWTPDWSPSLRLELFPSSHVASSYAYYDDSAVKPIVMKPVGSNIEIEFDDLGTPGEIRLHMGKHVGAIDLNGQALVEGAGYRVDRSAEVITIPFKSGVKLVVHDFTDR